MSASGNQRSIKTKINMLTFNGSNVEFRNQRSVRTKRCSTMSTDKNKGALIFLVCGLSLLKMIEHHTRTPSLPQKH
jgi:hypothetical protein